MSYWAVVRDLNLLILCIPSEIILIEKNNYATKFNSCFIQFLFGVGKIFTNDHRMRHPNEPSRLMTSDFFSHDEH